MEQWESLILTKLMSEEVGLQLRWEVLYQRLIVGELLINAPTLATIKQIFRALDWQVRDEDCEYQLIRHNHIEDYGLMVTPADYDRALGLFAIGLYDMTS